MVLDNNTVGTVTLGTKLLKETFMQGIKCYLHFYIYLFLLYLGCGRLRQLGSGQKINIYCATLQNSTSYHAQDFTQPTALVVGTEATGLSELWREKATQNIIIPMQGEIDSMNVSVAAAILIFEAKRQRGFK